MLLLTDREESDLASAVGEEADYIVKPFSPSALRERLRGLED